MKYFVTYKKLGSGYPDESDYTVCELKLSDNGKVIYKRLEHDSMGKLHVHYIFEHFSDKQLYRNKLEVRGYNKFVLPILDSQVERVIWNYLQKEDREWFRTHYAF